MLTNLLVKHKLTPLRMRRRKWSRRSGATLPAAHKLAQSTETKLSALKNDTIPNRPPYACCQAVFTRSSGCCKRRKPALLTARMQPEYSNQNTTIKIRMTHFAQKWFTVFCTSSLSRLNKNATV